MREGIVLEVRRPLASPPLFRRQPKLQPTPAGPKPGALCANSPPLFSGTSTRRDGRAPPVCAHTLVQNTTVRGLDQSVTQSRGCKEMTDGRARVQQEAAATSNHDATDTIPHHLRHPNMCPRNQGLLRRGSWPVQDRPIVVNCRNNLRRVPCRGSIARPAPGTHVESTLKDKEARSLGRRASWKADPWEPWPPLGAVPTSGGKQLHPRLQISRCPCKAPQDRT